MNENAQLIDPGVAFENTYSQLLADEGISKATNWLLSNLDSPDNDFSRLAKYEILSSAFNAWQGSERDSIYSLLCYILYELASQIDETDPQIDMYVQGMKPLSSLLPIAKQPEAKTIVDIKTLNEEIHIRKKFRDHVFESQNQPNYVVHAFHGSLIGARQAASEDLAYVVKLSNGDNLTLQAKQQSIYDYLNGSLEIVHLRSILTALDEIADKQSTFNPANAAKGRVYWGGDSMGTSNIEPFKITVQIAASAFPPVEGDSLISKTTRNAQE